MEAVNSRRVRLPHNELNSKRNKSQPDAYTMITDNKNVLTAKETENSKPLTEQERIQQEKKEKYKQLRMKASQVTAQKKYQNFEAENFNKDNHNANNNNNNNNNKNNMDNSNSNQSLTKNNQTLNNDNSSFQNNVHVYQKNYNQDDVNNKSVCQQNTDKKNDDDNNNNNNNLQQINNNTEEMLKINNKQSISKSPNIKPSSARRYSLSKKTKNDNDNDNDKNYENVQNTKNKSNISSNNNNDQDITYLSIGHISVSSRIIDNNDNNNNNNNSSNNNNSNHQIQSNSRSDLAIKSQFRPYYLQRPSDNNNNNSIGMHQLKERTWHEKKRDARVNEQFRKAEMIEKEYIRNFKEYCAVYYNNLQINKNNDNEEAKINNINLENIQIDFGDINVDICQEMLITQHESWEGRMEICNELINQINDLSIPFEIYYLKLAKFLYGIYYQFADNRSLVLQEMNKMFSKFCKETASRFIVFAPYLFKATFIAIPIRIEVLREAAIEFAQNVIISCCKYDTNQKLLDAVIEGLSFQHALTRCVCADLLEYMIQQYPILEKPNSTEVEKQLLEKLDNAIKVAVYDSSSETRANGYRSLYSFQKIAPSYAKEIIDNFSRAVKKKYDSITNRSNSA